jgi:thiol-disulfide isomerase/thioredoxin
MNKKTIITILFALLIIPMGVEAKKKSKKEEIPQLLNFPSAELSEYRLHGGNVVVQGHIVFPEEVKGEKMPQEALNQLNGRFTVIMRDYIVRKEKTSVIEFKDDATFSMNVYVPYPMQVLVYPLGTVYACPGDTINVTIDPTKRTKEEGIKFDGTGLGGEVTRLWQQIDDKYCKPDWSNKVYEKGPDSLMAWKDEQVAQLDELVRQMNNGLPELAGCSPLASDILRTHILAERLQHINDYYMRGDDKLHNDSTIDREAYWQQFYSFVGPRAKYLTDNPLLMIAGDELFFNRLEFQQFRPLHKRVMVFMPFDYDPKTAEMIAQEKQVYSREFNRSAMNELHDKLHISPTDFSAQVCKLRDFFSTIEWYKNEHETIADDFAATMTVITHPELIRRAVLTYRDFIKENEIKAVESKPLTKGDSIFQRIIEPYKGNVLYVDFWEMSCGPCRGKMLSMRDEVEANKDKPVKYLYITDDTPEQCKSFLEPNNIKGEHIHITRVEWGYLQEKFQFTAIPFIALFDKDGKQRENTTVQQLLEEMK